MNYPIQQSTQASDKIRYIFSEVANIFSNYSSINFNAMVIMQSLGFNGFKRWHRIRSKEFHALKICLANELFDVFRKKADFKDELISYDVPSMEVHLKTWDSFLKESILKLGDLNKEFYNETGLECEIVSKAVKIMKYDYEKVGRYYERFSSSDWLNLDMHIVDDCVHTRMKKREEKHE